jgi:hypothetical protein
MQSVLITFYRILELFRHCGIICFSRFWNCSDSVVLFVFLDFELAGGWGLWFFFRAEFFFRTTRVLEHLFFLSRKGRFFFPEFNIRLYDKNSESDYYFFLHQNQNIFSATLGIRIFSFRKKKPIPSPPLQVKWSFPK